MRKRRMDPLMENLMLRVEYLERSMKQNIRIKPTTQLNQWDGKSCSAREFESSRTFNVCNECVCGNDYYCKRHSQAIRRAGVLRDGDVRIKGEGCLPRGHWKNHDKWMAGMDITLGPFEDTRTRAEKSIYPDIVKSKNQPPPPISQVQPRLRYETSDEEDE